MKLVERMSREYNAVIKANGGYFEDSQIHIQWGKKVFSQPPIVQVLPLKKMRGL
jgi:hypothetical protein